MAKKDSRTCMVQVRPVGAANNILSYETLFVTPAEKEKLIKGGEISVAKGRPFCLGRLSLASNPKASRWSPTKKVIVQIIN